MSPGFFNPYQDIRRTRHNLPHWQQPGATCFVTFRLADSLPRALLDEWTEDRTVWLRAHPLPWSDETAEAYRRRFSVRFDAWLDAGHGSCALRDTAIREELACVLRFFDGVRYELVCWVIMPNHAHVCFTLRDEWPLEKIVAMWKRESARAINARRSTTGTVWQRDYFDRLVRDMEHFRRVVRYIRRNGERAGLGPDAFTLWESEAARAVE